MIASVLWLGCQSAVEDMPAAMAERPEALSEEGVSSGEAQPDPLPPPLASRPEDFEERPELEEAYRGCDQSSGQEAKDCVYHLWQSELMALRPGAESSSEALDAVRRVYFAHRDHARIRNPQFEERFWAWFWGAWWKEQPRSSWGNPEGCLVFPSKGDQDECLRYSERAWDWLVGRKIQVSP